MALIEMEYFWSNLLAWGYRRTLPLYHAFVIDMVIAMGHGIPASSESRFIHAVNKASSERDGDGDSNAIKGRQARSK